MRIFVDVDACPVVSRVESVARWDFVESGEGLIVWMIAWQMTLGDSSYTGRGKYLML